MSEKRKVTIYDLAEQLNTTASTVSRALQNNQRISQKTREAVQKLAKELGYVPDPIALQLRTGHGHILGIVVPHIDSNYFPSIISAFQTTAQRHNYNVIVAASNENQEEEMATISSMIGKKVDAIAVSLSTQTNTADEYEKLCNAHNVRLLFFDRVPEACTTDTVTNDNFQIGYDAVVQLYKAEHKRIGHFAGLQHIKLYNDYFEGYRTALQDLGLPYVEEWVYDNCLTFEAGGRIAKKIIDTDYPDAIFSASDNSAIAAMDIFRREGKRLPKFVGVGNEPFDSYLPTPLTSFDLKQKEMGEKAATLLLERLTDDEQKERQHIIVPHELMVRDSDKY